MTPERRAELAEAVEYNRALFARTPPPEPDAPLIRLSLAEVEEYLALLDERARRDAHRAVLRARMESVVGPLDATDEEAPFVCPGCYAVGPERCLPGCVDAEIEEERRTDFSTSTDPPDEADEENDEENNVS